MAARSFAAFIRTETSKTLVVARLPEDPARILVGIDPVGALLDGDTANRLAYALRLRENAEVAAEDACVVRIVRTNRGEPYRDGVEVDIGTKTRCEASVFLEDEDAAELADFIAPRP